MSGSVMIVAGFEFDEDDAVALLAQRLAGLRTGIVEFAGLADDDRAGADDQDALDVGALAHQRSCHLPRLASLRAHQLLQAAHHQRRQCSKSGRRSCGPGLASGWPWKPNAGRSVRATPCSVPSNSDRCVGLERLAAAILVDREAVVLRS